MINVPLSTQRYRKVLDVLQACRCTSMLDAGCNTGGLVHFLLERSLQAFGLETIVAVDCDWNAMATGLSSGAAIPGGMAQVDLLRPCSVTFICADLCDCAGALASATSSLTSTTSAVSSSSSPSAPSAVVNGRPAVPPVPSGPPPKELDSNVAVAVDRHSEPPHHHSRPAASSSSSAAAAVPGGSQCSPPISTPLSGSLSTASPQASFVASFPLPSPPSSLLPLLPRSIDLIASVEVIEHLYPTQVPVYLWHLLVELGPRVGCKAFVLTTPNRDRNVTFLARELGVPGREGGDGIGPPARLRHPDHKYEWTQADFRVILDYLFTSAPIADYWVCDDLFYLGGLMTQGCVLRRRTNTAAPSSRATPSYNLAARFRAFAANFPQLWPPAVVHAEQRRLQGVSGAGGALAIAPPLRPMLPYVMEVVQMPWMPLLERLGVVIQTAVRSVAAAQAAAACSSAYHVSKQHVPMVAQATGAGGLAPWQDLPTLVALPRLMLADEVVRFLETVSLRAVVAALQEVAASPCAAAAAEGSDGDVAKNDDWRLAWIREAAACLLQELAEVCSSPLPAAGSLPVGPAAPPEDAESATKDTAAVDEPPEAPVLGGHQRHRTRRSTAGRGDARSPPGASGAAALLLQSVQDDAALDERRSYELRHHPCPLQAHLAALARRPPPPRDSGRKRRRTSQPDGDQMDAVAATVVPPPLQCCCQAAPQPLSPSLAAIPMPSVASAGPWHGMVLCRLCTSLVAIAATCALVPLVAPRPAIITLDAVSLPPGGAVLELDALWALQAPLTSLDVLLAAASRSYVDAATMAQARCSGSSSSDDYGREDDDRFADGAQDVVLLE